MTVLELLLLATTRRLAASGEARAIRAEAGLSRSEVAEALGVAEVTVYRWESRERRPRGDAALRYGRLLLQLREVLQP